MSGRREREVGATTDERSGGVVAARRDVLLLAPALYAFAALNRGSPAAAGKRDEPEAERPGYRLSAHVRRYYELAAM